MWGNKTCSKILNKTLQNHRFARNGAAVCTLPSVARGDSLVATFLDSPVVPFLAEKHDFCWLSGGSVFGPIFLDSPVVPRFSAGHFLTLRWIRFFLLFSDFCWLSGGSSFVDIFLDSPVVPFSPESQEKCVVLVVRIHWVFEVCWVGVCILFKCFCFSSLTL